MEWNWPKADEGRIKRASTVKFRSVHPELGPIAYAIGSGSDDYLVTLHDCTCSDFFMSAAKSKPQPCKHMLAMAMTQGILNKNGNTPEQQREEDIKSLRNQVASAYGYYYHFHAPLMSDEAYDKLKRQLSELENG